VLEKESIMAEVSNLAAMTVVEVAGSHAIYVSRPNAVAALIENAAKSTSTATN
jgi:hypothetical protein